MLLYKIHSAKQKYQMSLILVNNDTKNLVLRPRSFLLYTFIIFFTTVSSGQDSRHNRLSLYFGAASLMRQDLIFSPFVHKDFSMANFGLNYEREAGFYQRISIGLGNYTPMLSESYYFIEDGENEIANPHFFMFIDAYYMLGKELKAFNKSSVTIGGIITSDIQQVVYVYGNNGDFGYFTSSGIGGFGKYNYSINERNRLTAVIRFPIVSWLARSPYLVNDDEFYENTVSHSGFKIILDMIGNGEPVTLNRLQSFEFETNYSYNLSSRFSIGAGYLFEFIHSGKPRNLLSFRNMMLVSLSYRF